MASITVENYVKQLYLEQQNTPQALVSMGALAAAMGVVPGTVTTMVKALADSGLVEYEPRGGVRLTRGGEQLEHAISDKVLERLDDLLGRPTADPHGDPIPTAKGKVAEGHYASLADCPVGRPLRVVRVRDQDPAFLQFVEKCGLRPGVAVTVESRDPAADAVWVKPHDRRAQTMGTAAAVKILVEEA